MWRINYKRVYAQINVNESLRRLEWKPSNLKDNIFEVIAVITKLRDLEMKGDIYFLKGRGRNRIYAWNFDYKDNPSRRKEHDRKS
jgi:hypothetical protein